MRNRLTAIMFAGLLVFGVAACDTDGTTDTGAPAGGAADPAAPADPGMDDPALDGGMDDAMEPTEDALDQ
jgi:hypothetical protein